MSERRHSEHLLVVVDECPTADDLLNTLAADLLNLGSKVVMLPTEAELRAQGRAVEEKYIAQGKEVDP
jgi:hypothetical protein